MFRSRDLFIIKYTTLKKFILMQNNYNKHVTLNIAEKKLHKFI
jgi:hypothetical protein